MAAPVRRLLAALYAVVLPLAGFAEPTTPAATPRPNILLILADDLGFSDLGCYGGEIRTPRLDRLAVEGVRFTGLRVNPMCTVSRASLYTGQTPYRAGLGVAPDTVDLARLLRDAGYLTSLSGKWHLGGHVHPRTRGYERFYGVVGGQFDSFRPRPASGAFYHDDQLVTDFPADFYATTAFTDHALASIDAARAQHRPFFVQLAYNAPHTPIQAPRELVESYAGVYDAGWSVLRAKRHERQRELGLLGPVAHPLSAEPPEVKPWSMLSARRRSIEALRMQSYAAMVEAMDTQIGRVLDHLSATDALDDTLVVFLSDNGADYNNGSWFDDHRFNAWTPGQVVTGSNGWSLLRNTPFRGYKHASLEGGLRVPLILRQPRALAARPGSLDPRTLQISDLMPTLLDAAGVAFPRELDGRPLKPLDSVSVWDGLRRDGPAGTASAPRDQFFAYHDFDTRAYVSGRWKVVSSALSPWELYDLEADPTELRDLAAAEPARAAELAARWHAYAAGPGEVPAAHRRPVTAERRYWGASRLEMIGVADTLPRTGSDQVPLDTRLSLTFAKPLDFSGGAGARILLYKVDPADTPVWSADPDERNPAQGKRTIVFTDLPRLEPGATYFVVWEPGFVKFTDGTAPGPLNDGAFWLRFRTARAAD